MLNIKNIAVEAVLMETHRCNKSWSVHARTDRRRRGRGDSVRKGKLGVQGMHLSFVLALTLQFNFRFTPVKISIKLKFLVFDLRQTIFKICFWDLLFSLVTLQDQSNLRLVKILVIAELWGVRSGRSGAPWLRKSGYPCIREILVGT